MTVEELLDRFPEIPPDLAGEPALARFAEVFDGLLRQARNPSACATRHDAGNHYYLKLIGPLSIYGFGLATRERAIGDIRTLLDRHAADPGGFAASLVPPDAAEREVRGPGCS
jgi:hypothetical protein